MAKDKFQRKCRNFMYEQQLTHLPNNMTMDDIYNHVEKNLKPKRMACILHNKDLKEDNKTPAEDHIHMMLQFENARSVNQVAMLSNGRFGKEMLRMVFRISFMLQIMRVINISILVVKLEQTLIILRLLLRYLEKFLRYHPFLVHRSLRVFLI